MIQYLNPRHYSKVSRYAKLRLIQGAEEKPYHEVTNSTPSVDSVDCELFHVTGLYVNRIDLIAQRFYGDPSLWWYIAKQNRLADPELIPTGTVLQIPKYNTLLTEGRVLEPMSYIYLNLGVDG